MYQENGATEFASVCNVTFKGMEIAGSFAKDSAKAFLRLCELIFAAARWGYNQTKDHQYKKSGRKSQKVMKDKFQGDVLYGKIENPQAVVSKQEDSKKFTPEQLQKLPDSKWIEKKFEQLAKKHGLEYCLMPNLSKEHSGLFIQYPKLQENVYQEIMAALQEEIKKKCEKAFDEIDKENEIKCGEDVKKCRDSIEAKKEEIAKAKEELKDAHKIGDKVGEQKYGELVVSLQEELKQLKEQLKELIEKQKEAKTQTGSDIIETLGEESKEAVKGKVSRQISQMQYLEQSGLLNASDKEFETAMEKTFPQEYAEIKKELYQNTNAPGREFLNEPEMQKKKKEFVRRMNNNVQKEAKEQGLTVEFTINAADYVKTSEKTASFAHPEHPEFMISVSTKDVCGLVDDSKVKKSKTGKISGTITMSVYKDAVLEFKVPVLDAVSGDHVKDAKGNLKFEKLKMSYDEFDTMVKEIGITAAVAMKQKQRELNKAARQTKRVQNVKQKGAAHAKK